MVCYGYPPSAYNQNIYTSFPSVLTKSNVPHDAVETLRENALKTSLFEPVGKGNDLVCRTDRSWDEPELTELTSWLSTVIARIRQYETENPGQGSWVTLPGPSLLWSNGDTGPMAMSTRRRPSRRLSLTMGQRETLRMRRTTKRTGSTLTGREARPASRLIAGDRFP